MKKILICLFCIVILCSLSLSFFGCDKETKKDAALETIEGWQKKYTAGDFGIRSKNDPFVEFTLSTGDTVRVELYPDYAPISVENFLRYVQDGFYDGVLFHRVVTGFMVQTGGYVDQDGTAVRKASTYDTIKGEFLANGVNNTVAHRKGVISMARATPYDSASCEFFICTAATSSLDGLYAAFGRVIDEESMEAIKKVEATYTLYSGETGGGRVPTPIPEGVISITKATLIWANH